MSVTAGRLTVAQLRGVAARPEYVELVVILGPRIRRAMVATVEEPDDGARSEHGVGQRDAACQRAPERSCELRLLIDRNAVDRDGSARGNRLADVVRRLALEREGVQFRGDSVARRGLARGVSMRWSKSASATGSGPAYHVRCRAAATRARPASDSRIRLRRSKFAWPVSSCTRPAPFSASMISTMMPSSTRKWRAISTGVSGPWYESVRMQWSATSAGRPASSSATSRRR